MTILRICLRLLSDGDSLLLPVYAKPGAPETGGAEAGGCAAACQVAIHLLQLLTLLHPNVFCMHVQRIAQSAIVSRLCGLYIQPTDARSISLLGFGALG